MLALRARETVAVAVVTWMKKQSKEHKQKVQDSDGLPRAAFEGFRPTSGGEESAVIVGCKIVILVIRQALLEGSQTFVL